MRHVMTPKHPPRHLHLAGPFAVAAVAGALSALPARAQDAAGPIVDQVIAAYGGHDAVAAAQALRLDGTVVTHPDEAHGSFVRISEGQDKLKVLLHYPTRVEIRIVDGEEGLNGSSPSSLSPASGPMLSAMQLQAARSSVPWILETLRDGLRVEGRDQGHVILGGDLKSDLHLRFFVDEASHHVVRTESQMSMGGMSMVFATDYGDFRDVSGVLIPFHEESFAAGTHTASLVVDSATLNPPADRRLLPTGG